MAIPSHALGAAMPFLEIDAVYGVLSEEHVGAFSPGTTLPVSQWYRILLRA